jgi:hypothetical protein
MNQGNNNNAKYKRGKTFCERDENVKEKLGGKSQKNQNGFKRQESKIKESELDTGSAYSKKMRTRNMSRGAIREKRLRRNKTFCVNINAEGDPETLIDKLMKNTHISNVNININYNQVSAPQQNFYIIENKPSDADECTNLNNSTELVMKRNA